MASLKVHSAFVVGLLNGKMMGRLLQADIACGVQLPFSGIGARRMSRHQMLTVHGQGACTWAMHD